MIYLHLIVNFFLVGLFSIGGGYAALPQIQYRVVEVNGWLTLPEFADMVTISQMTPGPIAINVATFVGIRMGGFPGALAATLGCVLPSCLIVLLLAVMYRRYKNLSGVKGVLSGLRPAVVALIASAALAVLLLSLFNGEPAAWSALNPFSVILLIGCVIILRTLKPNPIFVMLGTGVLGIVWFFVENRVFSGG